MSRLELWRDPPEIDPSFHLPMKNEFIPHDFTIRCVNSSDHQTYVCLPRCIIDQPLIKLWYKLDETFKVPRANTYFLITVKGAYNDVKSFVLTELFVNLLKDELNEILYQAGVAKLETALSIIGDKLELKIYGFNDKLSVLLSKILATAKSFLPADDRFKVIKEDMERAFRNTNMKPLNHSTYLRLQLLRENFWDVDDKLSCLADLSLSELKTFIPGLLSQLHVEGLCHGNLSKQEVIHISDIFRSSLSISPLTMKLRHKERIVCLPSGADLVRDVHVKNKLEVNSVVEIYYQIEQDFGVESTKLRALADLFDDIVEEPLFNQLRYLFDMLEKEAEDLKSIHKSDVIDWYNTYLRPSSPKCRRLAICVWGCNTNMKDRLSSLEHVKAIEDLDAFKMSLAFYPSLC